MPTALLDDVPIAARVKYRDDGLFDTTARLAKLLRGDGDDLSMMAAQALGETLERHFRWRYGTGNERPRRRLLSASDRILLADNIRGQLDARHSLDVLAARVGMDVRRFTGAFQQAFGRSPWQYLMRVRLDEAARRLRNTNEPVTDVALATGFATPSHFATAFARRFGMPPSRYRATVCR